MTEYKKVKVVSSPNGYGGPLYIQPTDEKPYICSLTGMSIHKIAKEIANLTGGILVNAFIKKIPMEQMAVIVTDCGGTARCTVYPSRGVKTIDVFPVAPAGGNASFMTPDIFCSGVNKTKYITLVEE